MPDVTQEDLQPEDFPVTPPVKPRTLWETLPQVSRVAIDDGIVKVGHRLTDIDIGPLVRLTDG